MAIERIGAGLALRDDTDDGAVLVPEIAVPLRRTWDSGLLTADEKEMLYVAPSYYEGTFEHTVDAASYNFV